MKKKKSSSLKRVINIFSTLPKLYKERLTPTGVMAIRPNRDIYYSTIFALGSAALAFLPQFLAKEYTYKWLLVTSSILFGLTLITVILIHFLSILQTISWSYFDIQKEYKEASEAKIKDAPTNVVDALQDSFALMVVNAYLDSLLLLTLIGALICYCIFIVISI